MLRALTHAKLLLEDRQADDLAILFDGRIRGILPNEQAERLADEVRDVEGAYISPGLIDVHIHGYRGFDASDGDEDGLRAMARALPENGVTAFLPTTMTVSWPELETAFTQIRALMKESREPGFGGAQVLGCHAEGPFINADRKGAQREDCILPPDAERVLPWADVIRLMTYAPEKDPDLAFTRAIREKTGIALSIGHTSADYDTSVRALGAGADHFTHTFNAMTPLKHRDPGAAGASLCSGAFSELIADTFHVNPALFSMMVRCKGEQLLLITDCTRAGGMPDGEYELGGQKFTLRGIECRFDDGTIAGSVLRLNRAVKNLWQHASIPLWQAVRSATLTAARSVRCEGTKGSLRAGKDADLAVMDDELNVLETYVAGERVYARDGR